MARNSQHDWDDTIDLWLGRAARAAIMLGGTRLSVLGLLWLSGMLASQHLTSDDAEAVWDSLTRLDRARRRR